MSYLYVTLTQYPLYATLAIIIRIKTINPSMELLCFYVKCQCLHANSSLELFFSFLLFIRQLHSKCLKTQN